MVKSIRKRVPHLAKFDYCARFKCEAYGDETSIAQVQATQAGILTNPDVD